MDRFRRLGHSKSSGNKIAGNQQIHNEKKSTKLASPNVVARLMGLDGLPSQQSPRGPQKRSDSNVHIAEPILSERDTHQCDGRSYKKSGSKQPEFKDVYEDTIEKSCANKDSTLQLPRQPKSLFVKHLLAQEAPSSFLYDHIAVLKPSNSSKHEVKVKGWKAEREASKKPYIVSRQIHADEIFRHSYDSHGSQNSHRRSPIHIDGKDETNIDPKKIVILKPNYVKARNALNSFSSPDSAHATNSRNHKADTSSWTGEPFPGEMGFPKNVGLLRPKYREATETVNNATRGMRKPSTCIRNSREVRETARRYNIEMLEFHGHMVIDFPTSVREIPETKHLYDFSGAGFGCDSEFMKWTPYDSKESFSALEAKNALLERWKMAYRYQDERVGDKGKTLGEMLSISDVKERNLNDVIGVHVIKDKFDTENESAKWDGTCGISNDEGWKARYYKLSPRSRSVCPLSGSRREKMNTNSKGEIRTDDKLLRPKRAKLGQRKAVHGNRKEKEYSSSKKLRSSKENTQYYCQRDDCNTQSVLETHPSQDQTEVYSEEKDPPEEQPDGTKKFTRCIDNVDAAAGTEHGYIAACSQYSDNLSLKQSICMGMYGDCSAGDLENLNPQCTRNELESKESSKETDNPSPVSTLEVLFRDDVLSGPESFEQVSADLRELQKQLQLLKGESEAYADAASLLKNDNNVVQGLTTAVDNKTIIQSECWESSYMVDVLTESGFNNTDNHLFTTTWCSPDRPLKPWVFDNLENKYNDGIMVPRYERRLLFDRINSAFSEISKSSSIDPCPWVSPLTNCFGLMTQKGDIGTELRKVLLFQEKEANDDIPGKLLDREMDWLDSGDFINKIGTETEKMLIDDLITELVTM